MEFHCRSPKIIYTLNSLITFCKSYLALNPTLEFSWNVQLFKFFEWFSIWVDWISVKIWKVLFKFRIRFRENGLNFRQDYYRRSCWNLDCKKFDMIFIQRIEYQMRVYRRFLIKPDWISVKNGWTQENIASILKLNLAKLVEIWSDFSRSGLTIMNAEQNNCWNLEKILWTSNKIVTIKISDKSFIEMV